jgi:hypothetical protein
MTARIRAVVAWLSVDTVEVVLPLVWLAEFPIPSRRAGRVHLGDLVTYALVVPGIGNTVNTIDEAPTDTKCSVLRQVNIISYSHRFLL